MTILDELRAEVREALRRSAGRTLLWMDPQHEWGRLLAQLATELELVGYDGSQLELRMKIEVEPAQKPRIVYVPLARQALSALKEYEFTLPVWDEGLLHALRRWGVGIDRDEERVLLPLLPSLVARWSDKSMDYWRHLTAGGVRARLFDDEQVLVFLADPDSVIADLDRDGALAVFHDYLAEAFGVAPVATLTTREIARRLVPNLMLAEAAERGGRERFPYQARLPEPRVCERCLRFLSRWIEARTQAQIAAQWLREAERDIPLGPWATTIEPIPDVQASLNVERALVQRILADLRTSTSLEERATSLADSMPVFRRHGLHLWAVEGEVPEWEALALAGTVTAGAGAALAELSDLRTAPEIVHAYVDRWWQVDRAYRRYRAGFEEHLGLDEVADTVRKLHRRYLEETNKRFAVALESAQGLEATGLPPQRSFWPASDGGRQAILVLDAFRFDLARELEEKLRSAGGQVAVELRALRAPLPSITPVGMASLLPLDGLEVDVSDGIWSIRSRGVDAAAPDLATKEGHERLLAPMVAGYDSIELGRLLELPVRQVPRVAWLFVYSTTLDEAGHGGVLSLTPRTAEEYVEQCARAVRKLANAGVDHIHVVTDHGFCLLDEVADHDLIRVTAAELRYKSHRAVVGRDLTSPSLLTFPLVGSDLTVGVPRATGILEARGRYQFFHGGASLQEIVIPHLCATFPRRTVKFDVRLHVPRRVTSLIFDVELEAVPPGSHTPWGDKYRHATSKFVPTFSRMGRSLVRRWRALSAPTTSFPRRGCGNGSACGSVTRPASGMAMPSASLLSTRILQESSSTRLTPRCTSSLRYEATANVRGEVMTVPAVDSMVDALDVKLAEAFGGRIVRKDLVKTTKVGFNVPAYVLEYLLGRYCSSTDPSIVAEGREHVKSIIAERFVRADEGELIKSRTRERGSIRLIDKVTVTYRETEDKYWASLANSGLSYVHIAPHLVQQYEKLLVGGVWANVEVRYDDSLQHRGVTRPFTIEQLQPIQIASADLDEYIDGRRHFTRDEWIDVLIRSIGYEPAHPDFTFRRKLLYLLRLVPMVEHNYNLVELGPRGTGKSFVYREISPYVILVSGGQVTVPKLFVENSPPYRIGLVGVWDVVAFDEVAGSQFRRPEEKQIYKDYMEMGSFSRGSGKGTIPAYASFVFNGNIDGDVETRARTSHLFTSFPEAIRYDMAFHDRWHAYVPGWELPKMQPDYFTNHLGFIVDYLAEICRELRKRNYTDAYERHFRLGNHVEERDRKAIVKTVSGLLKLFHPDGQCEKAELEQYLSFAIEMRRRVKEQLKRMGGIEYAKVNLSYIDLEIGQETFVPCPELGVMQLIPEGQLELGDVFTVGFDKAEGRFGLFRIQVQATKGSGHLRVTGNPSKPMRDALQTAYDYLRANLRRLGSDRDLKDFDLHVQIQSLMQAKEGSGTGVALFIALLSAVLARPLVPQLVILGDLTIHGVLMRVDSLADKLKTAMDAGAKKVMIPTENKRDFADLPADIIDKLQIVFYSDPTNAGFRAMGLE